MQQQPVQKSVSNKQVNQCSGSAKCIKTGTLTFGSGGVHGSPGGGGGGHGHPAP